MGKGSLGGRAPTAFEMFLINKNQAEKDSRDRRIHTLHLMGYEVCQVDGVWFYRSTHPDARKQWTPMDKQDD